MIWRLYYMAVRVVNIHRDLIDENEVLFMIDRTSPLGNPFKINSEHKNNMHERNKIINQFDEYFNDVVEAYANNDTVKIEYLNHVNPNVANMMEYLNKIIRTAKYTNVALGCHCLPKRCHSAIIKSYIDKVLKADSVNNNNNNNNNNKNEQKLDQDLNDEVITIILKD